MIFLRFIHGNKNLHGLGRAADGEKEKECKFEPRHAVEMPKIIEENAVLFLLERFFTYNCDVVLNCASAIQPNLSIIYSLKFLYTIIIYGR